MGIGFSGDASRESASSQRENVGMDEREAREAENTQRLDKLPPEVWEKVLDELDENDLFPLALTCRYFRQKQKELVARTRQQRPESGKPCLTLTTTFKHWATDQCMPEKVHPTSADYLQFCSKETVSDTHKYRTCISCLAAFHGYLPLLQELIKPANKLGIQITGAAARGGQLETLQWLSTQKGFKLNGEKRIFAFGCQSGHLETMKWLRRNGCPWDELACANAAAYGQLEALMWLRSEGCHWDERTCAGAAAGGHLDVLKYAHENGCPWNEGTCAETAKGGNLDVLKYAHENGCPWDKWTPAWAAEHGQLDVLRYTTENGCPWDMATCFWAALKGHFDVLKYAHENGCPWDELTCASAAVGDHFDVLKYAHENGCPWDEDTCMEVAKGGDLDILKYAHENGCPWDERTCTAAAQFDHLDVLKYARENGCPWDRDEILDCAAESTREWVEEHLYDYSDDDE